MTLLQALLPKASALPPAHRALALCAAIIAAVLLMGYVHVVKQWMAYGENMRVAQKNFSGKRAAPTLSSLGHTRQVGHTQAAEKAGR
jgi:hypothetical protein